MAYRDRHDCRIAYGWICRHVLWTQRTHDRPRCRRRVERETRRHVGPRGQSPFQIANQGKIEHELVVLKTDLAANALKMRAADPTKVDEEAGAKNVGEVEDVAAGASKSETFDLAPGKYMLVCNVSGHYKSGMVAAFEVK